MTEAEGWGSYYAATQGRPPRPTMLRVLGAFAAEGRPSCGLAVDLGCGTGRDALPLLRRGWRVWALDPQAEALEALRAQAAAEGLAGLETVQARFEDATFPACELVNASFSLFACEPADFPGVWAKIRAALKPGGRFAGQILGERDSWRGQPATTTVTRAELDGLLAGLVIERLEEEEEDGTTPRGEAKHWHIWHINARRAG